MHYNTYRQEEKLDIFKNKKNGKIFVDYSRFS